MRRASPRDWSWALAAAGCLLTASCNRQPPLHQVENVEAFLARYWAFPIPPQGEAPADFTLRERDLSRRACGGCHPQQLDDYLGSRHAAAYSPGFEAQVIAMLKKSPASAVACYSCHVPLSEQRPVLRKTAFLAKPSYVGNPHFREQLQREGLVCAACHTRGHRRYGPLAREGQAKKVEAHGGVYRHAAFSDARFCAPCHQFKEDGRRLKGKLFEDTYGQWRRSSLAQAGVQCQTCHMPGRRHFFRGIHDPAMVKRALRLAVSRQPGEQGDAVTIRLINEGAGHHVPTYVTPKIAVRLWQADGAGRPIKDTLLESWVGWGTSLNLKQEYYDTRIPAGGAHEVTYDKKRVAAAKSLKLRITVYPDDFYHKFFTSVLKKTRDKTQRLLFEEALRQTEDSVFVLYEKTLPLPPL